MLEPVVAVGEDVVEAAEGADLGVDGQPGRLEEVEGLGVAPEPRTALDLAELVGPEPQVPAGGDLGVLLPQRTGARVPGVGEEAQAGLALALVQLLERGRGHVHLAPHLEHGGRVAGQPLGDDGDGADVLGHVLPHHAVAPGRAPHVPPVLVQQRAGDAVDLQLADVVDVLGDVALHPLAPRHQLVEGEGVVERHHRDAVADLGERGRRPAAHLLGGRVGGPQLGVGLLQGPQLPNQGVELGVGDLGVVEQVVPLGVVLDEPPQLLDADSPAAAAGVLAPIRLSPTVAWAAPMNEVSPTLRRDLSRLLPWLVRGLWAALPFTAGPALAAALDSASRPVQLVASTGLWLGWAVGMVATFAPHPIALTALRVVAPAAVVAAVAGRRRRARLGPGPGVGRRGLRVGVRPGHRRRVRQRARLPERAALPPPAARAAAGRAPAAGVDAVRRRHRRRPAAAGRPPVGARRVPAPRRLAARLPPAQVDPQPVPPLGGLRPRRRGPARPHGPLRPHAVPSPGRHRLPGRRPPPTPVPTTCPSGLRASASRWSSTSRPP